MEPKCSPSRQRRSRRTSTRLQQAGRNTDKSGAGGRERRNYVALDLDGQHYAFYEHLQPGSVKVKPGDRVRSGQVIIAGCTGESTGPHLHFTSATTTRLTPARHAFAGFNYSAYLPKEAFAQSQP
jgi:murein DD-endopeptidase MepM/ murein hydrolase activator NlpD